MNHELIIRHVPGYGWLPIVRDYDITTGQAGKEHYRGDFYRTVEKAVKAGRRHFWEAVACA